MENLLSCVALSYDHLSIIVSATPVRCKPQLGRKQVFLGFFVLFYVFILYGNTIFITQQIYISGA